MRSHLGSHAPEKLGLVKMYAWLHPDPFAHRRVLKDFTYAYAAVNLFFPNPGFWDGPVHARIKESLLFNPNERARTFPDIRTFKSVNTMPAAFWAAWDKIKVHDRNPVDLYPADWDLAIRPKIASLYKAGVIESIACSDVPEQAVAAAEPGRALDLYFDLRDVIDEFPAPSNYVDTRTIHLLLHARRVALKTPTARFALLRVWSAPHFYPLMIGYERRILASFGDGVGRYFAWKFIPKDMPNSEWSIHMALSTRVEHLPLALQRKLVVKRDVVLVMGESEEEIQRLATAVVFVVQTRPWRLEIDLWKSFVNVDLKFLEEMDPKWLE